jgi:hypothetical protein
VKPAKSRNVVFFPTAAAAERAGFRPCLRCRPEAAPGTPAWRGAGATVSRAVRLLEGGFLDDARTVEDLADALGMTARHLRRLFDALRGRLADRRRDDPAGAAREGAGRWDHSPDVRDRLRRGVREHSTVQRRIPRGVSPPADRRPPGPAPAWTAAVESHPRSLTPGRARRMVGAQGNAVWVA